MFCFTKLADWEASARSIFITDGKNVNGSEPYAFTKMYLAGAEQQIEIYRPVA